jgi:dolichol kinase
MKQITPSAAQRGVLSAEAESFLVTAARDSAAVPLGLDGSEFRRRLMHISPGFLPFLLWGIPHQDPWGPILVNAVLGLSAALIVSALWRFHAVARPGERDFRPAVLGYALPVLAALSLLRGWEEVGVMTLAVLAFGDGSATLMGLMCGGSPLPWNARKSWIGSLSFVLVGGVMATLVYWGEARPGVGWSLAALIGFTTALTAAVIESLPVRLNDNLRVGTTAALMGGALTYFLVG